MCLVCLKGPKHGERSWQNIREMEGKNIVKYLKKFVWVIWCQLFYFVGFDFGRKKLQKHMKKKRNREYAHTNQ
jgi:hypothetical protein